MKTNNANLSAKYLDNLPNSDYYEKSFMHKDLVSEICVSNVKNLVITVSDDGVVKMWKKVFALIEYIKSVKAHNGTINHCCFSTYHDFFYTTSVFDQTIKVFDLNLFDIQSIIKLDHKINTFVPIRLDSQLNDSFLCFSNELKLFEVQQNGKSKTVENAIIGIFNIPRHRMIVTVDESGLIEYLDCSTWKFVTKETNSVTLLDSVQLQIRN